MNWIQENKFLSAFFAMMLVGVGALGYLLFSASGASADASARYQEQSREFDRLRRLPLYPNLKNLKVLEGQKGEAAEAVAAFQAELATKEFPLDPMTPEQFQAKLKESVTAIRAKAAAAKVELPKEKFFLGFEIYEGRPPDPAASPALGRQLKAIEWLMEQLISNRITELKSLTRNALPEEKAKAPAPAKTARDPKTEKLAAKVITKNPLGLNFVCRQHVLVTTLNAIVGPKAPQFFIPRSFQVTNQNPKGPPKAGFAAADVAPVPADPAAPRPVSTYIVGEEQIEVALLLEIVSFHEPAAK